ncbi:MAG: adenylyltransferase/cytidyltransferase family protein [Deltaproteobacteria bacterium]|nr:adenylyltransferase/cytidyltransferase family protein [Deltaproteobacteria bacterium]
MEAATSRKLFDIEPLRTQLAEERTAGRRIVLCHGVFDLVHPGHIRHLETAARLGDRLVVSVTPDRYVNKGPGRPVFTERLRAESIAALSCVDYVVINAWPNAVETITRLRPDRYVKGSDYTDPAQDVTGQIAAEVAAVEAVGGQAVFTDELTFSSTNLINQFFFPYPDAAAEFLQTHRQQQTLAALRTAIEAFADLRVLVVGDVILDEYHYCSPLGKSLKGEVINTRSLSTEMFAGGVLAAANHVANFCKRVDVAGYLGEERTHESFIRHHLKPNIQPHLFYRKGMTTILKRRYVEPRYLRKFFEISYLADPTTPIDDDTQLAAFLHRAAPEYDVVLVTDFGHNTISAEAIAILDQQARFLAVNAQTNSANIGFNLVTKYPRADYICIDELEARLALHARGRPLDELIVALQEWFHARYVTITHGYQGCVIYSPTEGVCRVPALTNTVVDTLGAGDAFLAISSLCATHNLPAAQLGLIGNAAGAMHVGEVGNRAAVEKVGLLKFLHSLLG